MQSTSCSRQRFIRDHSGYCRQDRHDPDKPSTARVKTSVTRMRVSGCQISQADIVTRPPDIPANSISG
jgi:hypothetical protein